MPFERDVSIRLQSESLRGDELVIHSVVGSDSISQLFTFTIEAERVEGAQLDEDALLLRPAFLTFSTPTEEVHTLYGLISRIRDIAEPQMQQPRYELTLVPRAFAATMREMLDIFMEKSVPEIIQACLTRCGLEAGEHFDLGGLTEPYPPKEFVVQYRETDFAFISRLCEHHGIFFFVDHRSGKDVLTFGDRNAAFPTSERTPELAFMPIESSSGEFHERIGSVDVTRTGLPKRYTVRDYNYRMPGVDLLASVDVDPQGLGEIVEYGAHFKTPDEGTWFASVRMQELKAHARIFELLGNAPATCAGQKLTLTEHAMGDTELLVTSVRHDWSTSPVDTRFGTKITAILAGTQYRPPRLTPKPRVNGVITGMIDAGVKDGYADVDDQGRYRVKFMFDTAGRGEGQASRLVRMAQPHAGEGYGMHFPVRPGTEVILSCIDGDPDRPIITGTVPNPSTASPVSSANRDRNMIRTGGGNEIDISDEDGAHRIKLSTPHSGTVLQLGAPNAPEDGAIFSTTTNVMTQAAGTVGSFADVASTISEIRGSLVGKSITSTAGVPNKIEGFDKVDKLLQSGTKAVQSVATLTDSVLSFGKKTKDAVKAGQDYRKKQAEDEILAMAPAQKYPDNAKTVEAGNPPIKVLETEAQFRARIVGERRTSAPSSTVSQYDDANAPDPRHLPLAGTALDGSIGTAWAAEYKPYADAVTGGLGTIAAASATAKKVIDSKKKWFSKTHDQLQMAMDKVAFKAAQGTAVLAQGGASAAEPRGKLKVRLPRAHYNLVTATDSVILEGVKGFYAMSPLNSYMYGGQAAAVVSSIDLHLLAPVRLEAAGGFVYVTAKTHLDYQSNGDFVMKSKKNTETTVGEKLKVVSEDDTSHESKKKFFLKTKELLDVDGGDEVKMKAKKWTIESTEGDYKTTVKGMHELQVDGQSMQLKHGEKLRVFATGANVLLENMDGGKFLAGSSYAKTEVNGGTSMNLKTSDVTIEAKSKFEVNASTIKINGKVLLGG
jgi:type VI secretion system VgrG family protein